MIKQFEYRAELFVWAVLTLFSTIVFLLLWMSVFQGQSSIAGLTVGQIIHYYLLATIINGVTASHFESWRSREIREGKIDHLMTKPMSYPLQVLLADVGNRTTYILIIVPLSLLIYSAYISFYQLESLPLTAFALLQFIGLLIFGYLVEFSFAIFAVFITFWFESGEGLEHFKWIIISLFSGYLIPVEFMPEWLRMVTQALPLKYIYSVPINILQGKQALDLLDLAYIVMTVIVMFLGLRFMWYAAVKKYTSAGG